MPGERAAARDPVVDLRACAIPPHYVQPWATVEVVRDIDAASVDGEGGGEAPAASAGEGDAAATAPLRPESALELLLGCAVRTGGVVHLLPAPTDAVCRGVRLLCRRAPEFFIPPLPPPTSEASAAPSGGGGTAGSHRSSRDRSGGGGRPRDAGRRRRGEGERSTGAGRQHLAEESEARSDVAAASRGTTDARGGGEKESRARAGTAQATNNAAKAEGSGCGTRRGEPGDREAGDGQDWARRLSEWGTVTTGSEVVVPHEALEVSYHDGCSTSRAPPRAAEPAWVEAVLTSHERSVVDDLSAALELAQAPLPSGGDAGGAAVVGETDKEGGGAAGSIPGSGALLVHGPPGVGKTRLVSETGAGIGGGGAQEGHGIGADQLQVLVSAQRTHSRP